MNRKSASLALQRGLQSLPEDARTVFVLKELEGLTYEEIAQTLNIKKGTVSSRLHYARKRLQEILADEWQEGGRHAT
jgi:RNA polymerase sigma-70 factor (ECF subfamily)